MIYRRLTLLLLGTAIAVFSFSQNPNPGIEVAKMQWQAKQVIPPAPEAAELGKYGNTPISLFTGTPNISIPLFELKGNSLSLPISLSYNASGYKPEDAATWVGSGWSLNAGGVITRSAMGNPDDETNYFGVANLLNPPNQLDITPYYTYMKNIQNGIIETQPDVYYYNFNGHTGKFVIRPDMSIVKKEKDLKIITPCISNSCPSSKFTIVDEDGITYIFDQVETTKSVPNDDAGQPASRQYDYVSSWYLSAMSSAGGDNIIEFEYYSTTNAHVLYQNLIPNKSVSYTYGCKTPPSIYCSGSIPVSDMNSSLNIPPTVSIKRKFLKKIILKKSSAVIAYAEIVSATGQREDSDFGEDRRVNQVKIFSTNNGTDKLVKQYNLSYSYFDTNPNAGPGALRFLNKRLRLDAVQEISTDINTASPPAYSFTYDANSSDRFTASLDHWGFYNASGNQDLVPNVSFAGGIVGGCGFSPTNIGLNANREASYNGSTATLLNKIKYPTGGYTSFTYELNKAKLSDNTIHDVGGVRISQVVDYSFDNKKAIAKNYTYLLDDGTSSGNVGIWPDYRSNSSFHHFSEPYNVCTPSPESCCTDYADKTEYTLNTISVSANSIFGLGSFQGSHIGYSQVTESVVDLTASGQPLGKTVYKYEIGQYLEHEEDIKNGELREQSVYRNDDKLLEQTTSSYQHTIDYDIVAQIVKAKENQDSKTYYCKRGTNDYYNYAYWQTPDPTCIPGSTAIYPTKLYLTNYTVLTQNKQLTKQVHKVYDQLSNSYITTTKNYTYGNPQHNYPTLIEETTTNGEKVLTAIKYVKDYSGTAAGMMADNIRAMQSINMMGMPVEKLQYRTDANGNNKKYISGQLTDYWYGRPVNLYFLEAQPPLSTVTTSSITSGPSMTFDSHYRLAGSISYDPWFNLSQQSKANDISKSYIWDYNRSYPVAEITGAGSNDVAYTSFESNGKGNFTFNGTLVTGSGITGKQSYNLNTGSITANTNSSTAYTVSYWRNGSSGPYSVSGSSSYKQGTTKNGWTYYEHTVSGTSTVTISGSGNIDEVRLYPAVAQMVTQTFEPLIGTTSQCTANSQLLYYEYDGLNRLLNIKDDDGNIVKNFSYNYGLGTAPATSAQTLWYNAATEGSFTKAGCTNGSTGTVVIYKVPYGKHASSISQADADAKATADKNNNGQAYANANGQCVYYNTAQSGWYQKMNCLPDQGPGLLTQYTIPANTYSSTVSVAAANALAQAALPALGQANANANGHCSCETEGTKYVNGACETGVKKYVGSAVDPAGGYTCYYRYLFLDGSYSTQTYSEHSNGPCPQNN